MEGSPDPAPHADLLARALRANPENLNANRLMSRVLLRQGRFSEALPFLEKAAAIEPGDSTLQRDMETARARARGPGGGP